MLILLAFSLGMCTHIGTSFMAAFLVNEASTPLLNWNWFLAALGANKDLYHATDEERRLISWEEGLNEEDMAAINRAIRRRIRYGLFSPPVFAFLYKLNGACLFVVFLLFRVLLNICILAVMVLTWYRLRSVWLNLHEWPYVGVDTPITGWRLANCAILTSLAFGHVCINMIWFAALYRAVRRKLCRSTHTATTPQHLLRFSPTRQ